MCIHPDQISATDPLPPTDADFLAIAEGDRHAFAKYINHYYNPTFKAIARFTGNTNVDVIALLTESVFLQLWGEREQVFFIYTGVKLYRSMMDVVVRFLREHGQTSRAEEIITLLNYQPFSSTDKHN